MSVEVWKSIFDWATVVLIAFTVVSGAGALITGDIINKRQETKTREFERQLTEAKTELGKQQERAAHAEKAAADASAKAEAFRLDIAKANERAALANQKAEEERLARVRIEEKLAGWSMDSGAQARLIEELKAFGGTHYDLGADPSEAAFMEVIDSMLIAAKWQRQTTSDNRIAQILLNNKARINLVSGFWVQYAISRDKDFRPAATALVEALRAGGIPAQGQMSTTEPNTTAIHIIIGKK